MTGAGGGIISVDAGSNADAGGVTVKPTTFTPALAAPTCRKIKDLLVGLPCSDDEVNTVQAMGPAGLQQLIISWTTGSTYQPMFQDKMISFFRNAFQQTGFTPTKTSRCSCWRTAASTSVRWAPAPSATTCSSSWCRTSRTASRSPRGS